MIDQKALKEILLYDPTTGTFTWICSLSNRAPIWSVAGSLRKDGRVQIRILGRIYFAHRLAWLWMTGDWPRSLIDHRNLDPSDNRWSNLREATNSQNMANAGVYKNNALKLKGVRFQAGKYEAHITVNHRQVYLGRYQTAKEAQGRYFEEAHRIHGEFARGA